MAATIRRGESNPVDTLVGARIRILRQRRKMSQTELGNPRHAA
jgi:hypothetical protein